MSGNIARETPVIKLSIQRMVCTGCGAEANASCNCGKAYVPKAVRAEEYAKQNPTASVREIEQETGVGHGTAQRAKAATVPHGTVSIGLDGKTRRMPDRSNADELAAARERADCLGYQIKKHMGGFVLIGKGKEFNPVGCTIYDTLDGIGFELDTIEPDRKECIALYQKVLEAEAEAGHDGRTDTEEQIWQQSLGNMACEAIAIRARWHKEFGDWVKFKAPSDLITLAKQAADEWVAIASHLSSRPRAHDDDLKGIPTFLRRDGAAQGGSR